MDAMRPKICSAVLLPAAVWAACMAGPAPVWATETDTDNAASRLPARFVRSQWHSLFLDGEKIGYLSQSLYRLSDGGHRLKCNAFLRRGPGERRFGL
ncbi:MAG: hypothetical protein R6X20_10330, partial [Phycisphaerae bacterium]